MILGEPSSAFSTEPGGAVADFYARREGEIDFEAERLQSAASKLANPISKHTLASFLREGDHVLDIGAGADASLGVELGDDYGYEYTAIDPNEKFVSILKETGVDARTGDVTEVSVGSNSIDAVHMRFVWGWLNEEQRRAALMESIRTLKPSEADEPKTIAVIDYDWSVVSGPDEFMEATAMACDTLRSFGFDPEYGGKLPGDLEKLARQASLEDMADYRIGKPAVYGLKETLGNNGLILLEETANSLKEGLSATGNVVGMSAIDGALRRLRALDPNTEITLPSIVVQTISIAKKLPSPERPISNLVSIEKRDYDSDMMPTVVPGVIIATPFSKLDSDMRILQASEYLKAGMISDEAIDENGMLSEDNYPASLLERSMLFVALSENARRPAAAVRLIETTRGDDPDGRLRSLPTARRLDLRMDDEGIFPANSDPGGVLEISAFIKNSQAGGGLIDMARVILGASAEARALGYHTGLMTIQERAYTLIKSIFGEHNFTPIEGPHEINIPGTLSEVKYVSLAVDVQSFLDGVRQHVVSTNAAMAREGRRKSSVLGELEEVLSAYFAYHRVA